MKVPEVERKPRLWKALAEYEIYTEADLNKAIQEMEPLNIGCMVSPVKKSEEVIGDK